MRRIGDVIYADVDFRGDGSAAATPAKTPASCLTTAYLYAHHAPVDGRVVEFATAEDLDYAVRRLDGSKLDGNTISVFKVPSWLCP